MEEEGSEKRKQRLQSLRAQAAAGASDNPWPPPPRPPQLSNPLLQSPPVISSVSSERFDYYTDPMSAFSGNKRRNSGGHHSHSGFTRHGGYSPPDMSHSPNSDQMHFSVQQHNSWRSPVQSGSPYSGYTGGQFYSHHNINASGSSPGPCGFRTPVMIRGVARPGPGGFHSGPSSGRSSGRGRSHVRGGGRGLRYYSGSTSQEQEHYYQKCMVEDPWKDLQPVVGNILVPRVGSDLGMPKSSAKKKPRVFENASEFKRETSLAEYLAVSLDETVHDDAVT